MLNKHMSKATNDKPVGPIQQGHPGMRGYGSGGMAALGGMFMGSIPPWALGGAYPTGYPGKSFSHTPSLS